MTNAERLAEECKKRPSYFAFLIKNVGCENCPASEDCGKSGTCFETIRNWMYQEEFCSYGRKRGDER